MRTKRARATALTGLLAILAGCTAGNDNESRPDEHGRPVNLDRYFERPCDMVPDRLLETLRLTRPDRVKIDRDIRETECRDAPVWDGGPKIGIDVQLWTDPTDGAVETYTGDRWRAWRLRWRVHGYRAAFYPPGSDPKPPASCSVDVLVPPKQLVTVGIGFAIEGAQDRCEDMVKKATAMVIDEITRP